MFKILILTILVSWSHGEDKPGPNGGKIRMPGPYHTEVVFVSATQVKVFLLDIQFKNPTVKDSLVSAVWKGQKAQCKAMKDYFQCDFAKGVNLKESGELTVESVREKQKGNVARYGQ